MRRRRPIPYLEGVAYLSHRERILFPSPLDADEDIVAAGGNLSPGVLLSAYEQGIFPWYEEGYPILWWSPEVRCILWSNDLHISKRLRRDLRRSDFRFSADLAFEQVIHACATVPRRGQEGTWITPEMHDAYIRLHHLGYAHSVEVWRGEALVGGFYGVSLGRVFFGESMFSLVDNASKAALVFSRALFLRLGITLVDCQVPTDHLLRMGAVTVPREDFLASLGPLLRTPSRRGTWRVSSLRGTCLLPGLTHMEEPLSELLFLEKSRERETVDLAEMGGV
ncbi:Leucyl/phenylalanyl-tRNA--protein transferase [Spirochaeta thermophila DSM 6578]|uniref:Leucyl/phenylalanyl-tRNA--protein transferase n=1 Tax=Winmispira thermophila (strain ATCC 700085 / DSM 6578 / Z-1203) TaxID=869211 RepID=G0GC86_WINT7|nr:leucyl/phenylalanyl-tRNA--protein transferase [Spirochaeta thermophila]AEJ61171.1 Leucyl/phenylalanyl-tRNA--protein transferase [Spirochaeta thermophila DSM 6578]